MPEIPTVSTHTVQVTAEAVADFPDQPLEAVGLPELSAHVAVKAKKPGTANDNEEALDVRHS